MEITCYPTYGYKKDGAWKIPMRVWVHTNRSLFGHPITHVDGPQRKLREPHRRSGCS